MSKMGSGFVVDGPSHIEALRGAVEYLEGCLDAGGKGCDELYAWYANRPLKIRLVANKLKDLMDIT